MEREVGGGIGMGNTCKPMAVLFQCMTKSTTIKKKKKRTIPKKKKCKKARSEEALQITEKRKDMKGKKEKERYSHLNVDFQRIASRDKKVFLSDQCKEIEENNRREKTRNLFKKIRDTKGTFYTKMGTIRTEMVWT